MIVVMAAVVAILFGAGVTLTLSRDLFRMVAGVVLVSNAISFFVLAAGRAPVTPRLDPLAPDISADPLVQALALTAIVITFGVASLMLGLVLRVHETHGSIRMEVLEEGEREDEQVAEQEKEEV